MTSYVTSSQSFPEISSNSTSSNVLIKQLLSTLPEDDLQYNGCTLNSQNRYLTLVEVECVVDSKAGVPAWFVNFIQQSWPLKTMGRYRKLMKQKRASPFEYVRGWL